MIPLTGTLLSLACAIRPTVTNNNMRISQYPQKDNTEHEYEHFN